MSGDERREAVPAGYKMTEVGVIPEDWGVVYLPQLGDDSRPPLKAGPFGSSLTKATYVPSGYKVYGQEQVLRQDPEYGDYWISEEKFRELQSCEVRPGDILLSLVGTAGKLLVIPEGSMRGVINPRLLRISLDKNRVLPQLFVYTFDSHLVQNSLRRGSQGGTMPVLNSGTLRAVPIPLPPLPEQRAIAEALSDVDNLLDALDRLIAKKRAVKQAAMQQLLTGKTRLPGFAGEWEETTLGEIGTCLRGVSYAGDSDLSLFDSSTTVRLLRANNIIYESLSTDDVYFVNAARVSESQILQKNDALICMANGSKALVGKSAIYSADASVGHTFGAFMGCFRTISHEADPLFVGRILQSNVYRKYIALYLAGSSINNLTPSQM